MSGIVRTPSCLGIALVAVWLAVAGSAGAQGPAAGHALTTESLGTMLENLGYEVKPWDNKKGYGVTWKQDTWTFYANASVSTNGGVLWLVMPLGNVEDPAKAKLAAVFGLLTENDAIGPLHFSYNTSNKRLYLNDPVPNVGVTPARLRKELEDMAAVLKRTEPMWDTAKW